MGPGAIGPHILYRNNMVQDSERNQDPLFPIMLVQFPVPVLVPFPSSVNKPLNLARSIAPITKIMNHLRERDTWLTYINGSLSEPYQVKY